MLVKVLTLGQPAVHLNQNLIYRHALQNLYLYEAESDQPTTDCLTAKPEFPKLECLFQIPPELLQSQVIVLRAEPKVLVITAGERHKETVDRADGQLIFTCSLPDLSTKK